MAQTVGIQIDADLYATFILRTGRSANVTGWIENIIQDYLDRTELEDGIWSKEHLEKVHSKFEGDFEATYGEADGSYQWDEVSLWNGTRIRMKYKGKNHYAEVIDEQVLYEGDAYSPSQFAKRVADGTSRNAWRDLWIRERGSDRWILADDMRRQVRAVRPSRLGDY